MTRGWQPIIPWLEKTAIQNKVSAHVMFVLRNYDLSLKVDIRKRLSLKNLGIAGPVKLGHNDDEFRSVTLGHNDEFRSETLGHIHEFALSFGPKQ